jgi:hypothetical protein
MKLNIGIQLNIKEISLISKILGNLTFNQRKKFLSKKEENLYIDLYYEFIDKTNLIPKKINISKVRKIQVVLSL